MKIGITSKGTKEQTWNKIKLLFDIDTDKNQFYCYNLLF